MIPLKPFLLPKCSKATINRVPVWIAAYPSPSQSYTNYSIRHVNWPFVDIKFVNSRPCVLQPFMPFLRVAEMTSTSSVVSPSPIQIAQLIKLSDDHGNTVALKLVFANYKHSYNQPPFSIVIHRHPPFLSCATVVRLLGPPRQPIGPSFC